MPTKLNLNIPEDKAQLWEDVKLYKLKNHYTSLNATVIALIEKSVEALQ